MREILTDALRARGWPLQPVRTGPARPRRAKCALLLRALLERVPGKLRRILICDQGREMARHVELPAIACITVSFAEPHHPWQRGSNEAVNGLLRRFVGKGTGLAVYSQADLDAISYPVNTMP